MKRRRFVQALAGAPAASALLAQQPGANQSAPGIPVNPTRGIQPPGSAAAEELPKLEPSFADDVAGTIPRFFTSPQMAALRKLSEVLEPPMAGSPGAIAAGAPEFLDFLIGQSPADRQQVYRAGLDGLNAHAKKQFNKSFADLEASQTETLLASLKQPWTFEEPADPVARFLRAAKADLRTATMNTRDYTAGGRRFAGTGLYWYPLD
ncbi:MAG TPA: gluconate 2-dehydrogenase subunit 3 family protein [Bryobacteraceae bacterium]|nr:gluconate 2-dehydrogenase subunit 3 family protein [Bryobacteraceae bacterium]